MSTATTASQLSVPALGGRFHFLLRRLHSLTGVLFGAYIVIHLLVNATLIQGGEVFQKQVDKIHSLPFLLAVETAFIYGPIAFHAVYGVWMILSAQYNVSNYGYRRNWLYVFQRLSAIILVLFILFHVLTMKGVLGAGWAFDPHAATASTEAHFRRNLVVGWFVYPIGVLAGCFHLANGFYTAAVTWGLAVSDAAQKRWGLLCIGVFAFTFGCGMAAIIAALAK